MERVAKVARIKERENELHLKTPYDEGVILLAKSLEGRWERMEKVWRVPKKKAAYLLHGLKALGYELEGAPPLPSPPEDLEEILEAIREGKPSKPKVWMEGPLLRIRAKDRRLRRLRGRYDKATGTFTLLPLPEDLDELRRNFGIHIPQEVKLRLKEILALEEGARSASLEVDLKVHLWAHQRRAVAWMRELRRLGHPGAFLFFDMGLGKTLTAIAFAEVEGLRRVLVLAPKAVLGHWEREFGKGALPWLAIAPRGSLKERLGKAKEAWERAEEEGLPLALILNYEAAPLDPLGPWLLERPFDLLILDESHRIKDPKGKRSRFTAEIQAGFRLGLTGTPTPHSPLDIWGQARTVHPYLFGDYWPFVEAYAIRNPYGGVEDFQNLEDLEGRLRRVSLRLSKEEALDLPEAVSEEVEVELSQKAWRHYLDLYEELRTEVGGKKVEVKNVLSLLLRLQQITSGFLPGEIPIRIDQSKEEALRDLLLDLGRKPVVVFARFLHDLDLIRKIGEELGLRVGELSGRENGWEAFQYQGRYDLLAVQIQAGGVGVDLTRASYAIYYSLTTNTGDYLQSLARLHRPGQRHPVTYYHLLGQGTVDEILMRALKERKDLMEALLEAVRP